MQSPFRRRVVPLVVLSGITLLVPVRAAGAVYCAANVVEVLGALDHAAHDGGADVRIVAGTYSFSTSFGLASDGGFRISGGWDLGCTHQTPNGLLTTLQAHASASIGATFESTSSFYIDTLTFRDFKQGVVVYLKEESGGSSAPGMTPGVYFEFKLRACAFIHNGSVRVERPDGPNCSDGMGIFFRDNLVAQSIDSILATEITTCSDDHVEIVHNTFASNPGRALGVFGPTQPNVVNNAFANNTRNFAWDYFPAPGSPFFCGNVGEDFSSAEASHDLTLHCDPQPKNLAADPQLDPSTFEPLAGSPAIDFGWTPEELGENYPAIVFPDHDLQGDLRFSGLRPDAGAFESIGRCRP